MSRRVQDNPQVIDYHFANPLSSGLNVWLARYTKVLVLSTWILILAGGLVKSTESGLSVPDWPTTYGQFMFSFPLSDMVGGIFFEHGHRMIASVVGLLTVVMALWLARVEKRRWVRNLGFTALAAVVLQGLLGGLTVLYFLPDAISISHAVLAQTFFCMLIILAYSQSRERRLRELSPQRDQIQPLFKSTVLLFALIYVQLILGAIMRHAEAGLAVYDFPTMAGTYLPTLDQSMLATINSWRFHADLPPVTITQVMAHLVHRAFAMVLMTVAVVHTIRVLRHDAISSVAKKTAFILFAVLLMQFGLGVFTVLTQKHYIVTSVHVMFGALSLGVSLLAVLRASPVLMKRAKRTQPSEVLS